MEWKDEGMIALMEGGEGGSNPKMKGTSGLRKGTFSA